MKQISLVMFLVLVTYICSCCQGPTKIVWLDELGSDSCYIQDWGSVEVNRSVVHSPLTVNGVVYERGLGAHSISRLFYELDGKAVSISGLAGADDKNLLGNCSLN